MNSYSCFWHAALKHEFCWDSYSMVNWCTFMPSTCCCDFDISCKVRSVLIFPLVQQFSSRCSTTFFLLPWPASLACGMSTLDNMKSSPHYSNSKWLHIVLPGNLKADTYSCEWLLYIGPLRCACRECWNMPVQEWFAQWMNKHEASCFKEAEHTDLESLFWFFRWSYTQRCFLRLI